MYEYYECTTKDIDIDIIFVTYNHEKYIEQALESILSQKTKYKYRIIIGEDASTDNTRAIISRYYIEHSDKIALVLWKKNVGAVQNAYKLATMCTAKYVAMLEGDDYWTNPFKLEKQLSFLENHNEFIGTAHNVRCVDKESNLLHRDYHGYPIQEEHIYGKSQALNYELVSQTASFVYHNFWKTWNKKQYEAYNRCCANGDLKISIYLGLLGDIFYFRDMMSDHRRVFEGDSWTAKTHDKNMLGFQNANYREIKECMETILGKSYDFAEPYKVVQEEAFIRLFTEFNWENFSVCCRILGDNFRARK